MVSIHKCGVSSWTCATLLQGVQWGGEVIRPCKTERTFRCPLPLSPLGGVGTCSWSLQTKCIWGENGFGVNIKPVIHKLLLSWSLHSCGSAFLSVKFSYFSPDVAVDVVEPLMNLLESGELHEKDVLLKVPHPMSLVPDLISHIFLVSNGQKDPENTWIQWARRDWGVLCEMILCLWFLLSHNMPWVLCLVTAFPGSILNVWRTWELHMNSKFTDFSPTHLPWLGFREEFLKIWSD